MNKQAPFISILCIVFALIGCDRGGNKNITTSETIAPGADMEESVPPHLDVRVIEDTIIGRWTLKTAISANDVVINATDYTLNDSSVFVTLAYDNNPIFSDKEIRTKDLMGEDGEYQMYWGGGLHWYSDSTIYLSFGCFLPDTDFGWPMLYQIKKDGECDIIHIDYELGVDGFDVVSEFMTLYFCERAAGVPDTDLIPLFHRYCTENATSKLLDGTIGFSTSNIDFHQAYNTMSITWDSTDSTDYESPLIFSVEWKPLPGDGNVKDGINITVNSTENKIDQITCPYRKII